MKYSIGLMAEIDTSTSKIVLRVVDKLVLRSTPDDKRIVLMPVTSRGEDIYCVVNDKPAPGQIKRASDVLRWLAQNLLTKSELTKLAERPNET